MSEPKSTTLFLTEGSSDKEYRVQLEASGDGWVVNYQNGPRGRATRGGTKTATPQPYEKARVVYDKLVSGKTRKGYTEEVSGAAYAGGENAGRVTEFSPQLLNPLSREQGLAHDEGWLAQEKHDGERRGVILTEGADPVFANRRGLAVAVQAQIADAIAKIYPMIGGSVVLDAEDMGDHLVIFDIPVWPGQPVDAPFVQRSHAMLDLQSAVERAEVGSAIRVDIPMRFDIFKRERLPEIEARGGEGYVLKDHRAAYESGRRNSGGPALKVKFVESATCRVSGTNGTKRSVSLELDGLDGWTPVGNVTVPAGRDIPAAGSLIEVEYLYAYEGGSLFQPVFKGVRTDLDDTACKMDQLKFKGSARLKPDTEEVTPGL